MSVCFSNGTIVCKVTGSMRYSRDLPHGGLEVLCTLKFQGSTKDIDKVKKLLEATPSTMSVVTPQAHSLEYRGQGRYRQWTAAE